MLIEHKEQVCMYQNQIFWDLGFGYSCEFRYLRLGDLILGSLGFWASSLVIVM
jgi:hypothetical protein